jgi:uncharacterized protein
MMGAIFESLKKRFPDFPRLAAVENFVNSVTKNMDPLLIILFGALPRGDYTHNSDIDVLLVFDKPVTWNEVYAFGGGVVQPISKTRDDFINQLKKGNAFFIQIMEEGIVLHAKSEILADFKGIAADTITKMKITRVERGWDEIDPGSEE